MPQRSDATTGVVRRSTGVSALEENFYITSIKISARNGTQSLKSSMKGRCDKEQLVEYKLLQVKRGVKTPTHICVCAIKSSCRN